LPAPSAHRARLGARIELFGPSFSLGSLSVSAHYHFLQGGQKCKPALKIEYKFMISNFLILVASSFPILMQIIKP
jgi:hypothetical protein